MPAPKKFEFDRFSRNYINTRLCDAALPVSPTGGTITEIAWMLRLGKPCCFYGSTVDFAEVERSLQKFPVQGPSSISYRDRTFRLFWATQGFCSGGSFGIYTSCGPCTERTTTRAR